MNCITSRLFRRIEVLSTAMTIFLIELENMMKKLAITTLTTTLLAVASINLYAAEVCKVSMMGRVCFEEGSAEAVAAHMKGNAVADAEAAKSKAAAGDAKNDASAKKVATK